MKANEVIEKIKVMLGAEVKKHKFEATKTLVDGTEVYVEGEFGVGEALFVITEDGLIAAPEGNHETTDGFIVSVDANGIIAEIKPKDDEELPQIEEVENQEENVEDMVIVDEVSSNELVNAIVEALQPIMEEITEMKKQIKDYKEKMEKFSKSPASDPIKSKTESDVIESRFQVRLKQLTEKKSV